MICTKCQTENTDTAKYCKNCGLEIKKNSDFSIKNFASAKLVFIGLASAFVISLIQNIGIVLLTEIIDTSNYMMWRQKFSLVINILNLSNILIPLSIKNNTLKIIGTIFVVVPSLFYIISLAYTIMSSPY